MGPCKTSNFSIFTFIDASYLKFCTRSYSSCVYRMMRLKGSNGKVCKMMTLQARHFRTLLPILSAESGVKVVPNLIQYRPHDVTHC